MKRILFSKRVWLGGLVLPGALLLGVWHLRRSSAPPPPPPPIRDPRPPNELHEVGVLEPRLISRIFTPLNATLALVPPDGARVQEGDLLFRLDQEEIRSRIEEQLERIEERTEELETLQNEMEVLIATFHAALARDQAEWIHAELELNQRAAGLRPQERRRMEIQIQLAELDLEDRQERLARQQELVSQNFAAATSLDTYQREVAAAEAFLRERVTQLELEMQPLQEEERLTLQAAVDQARDVVERGERRHQREVASRQLEIDGVALQLQHQREDLARREADLENVNLLAPADGIIRLMRRLQWRASSWQTISVGQQTWHMDVLGDLTNPDDLTLRVLIHESDILRVRPGLQATAQLTAYPNQMLRGTVTQVSHLGQDRMDLTPIYRQAPPTQQAQFLAEIDLDTRDLPAMPGMTATVVIHLEEPQP